MKVGPINAWNALSSYWKRGVEMGWDRTMQYGEGENYLEEETDNGMVDSSTERHR